MTTYAIYTESTKHYSKVDIDVFSTSLIDVLQEAATGDNIIVYSWEGLVGQDKDECMKLIYEKELSIRVFGTYSGNSARTNEALEVLFDKLKAMGY